MSLSKRIKSRSTNLSLESLGERALMSASPLPVLLVIADVQDFYYREYSDTMAAIESHGIDVVVGATTTRPSTAHPNTGQPAGTPGIVVPDVTLADVDAADYSAIAFVGGWGASMYQYAYNDPNFDGVTDNRYVNWNYNADPNLDDGIIAPQKVVVNNLINDFLASDKPVSGICHGVTVLAWARVNGVSPVAGRQAAVPHVEGSPDQFYNGGWQTGGYVNGQRDQVAHNGGTPTAFSGAYGNPMTSADDVIVDGRIITAENPASALLFGHTIAQEVIDSLPEEGQPPTVSSFGVTSGVNAAMQAVRLTPVSFQVTASGDPGVSLTAEVDWDANGTYDQSTPVVDGVATLTRSFGVNGSIAPVVRVVDSNGLISGATALAPAINIVPAAMMNGNLVVGGTAGADNIRVDATRPRMTRVLFENQAMPGAFNLGSGSRVIVHAGDGNDTLRLSGVVSFEAFGGNGNDSIGGGQLNDILHGGEGNDSINAGNGNDLVIGGLGRDMILGGAGDDILIGGLTTHDDTSSYSTFKDYMAQWARRQVPVGLLSAIVDTEAADQTDAVMGGTGRDAFYVRPTTDFTMDLTRSDVQMVVS